MRHMRFVCIILTVLVLMCGITAQAAAPLSNFSEKEKSNAVERWSLFCQKFLKMNRKPRSLGPPWGHYSFKTDTP